MAIPTVYRWDDANAPQITNIHDWTQITDWFEKIFVTGYLEDDNTTQKPGLGWDLTYIATPANPTEYIIQLDMVGDSNVEDLMRIKMDLNDQINSNYVGSKNIFIFENSDELNEITSSTTTGWINFSGMNDDNSKICPWVVIGTSHGFYWFSGYNNNILYPTKPTDFSTTPNYVGYGYIGKFVNDGHDAGRHTNTCFKASNAITSTSTLESNKSRYYNNTYKLMYSRDINGGYIELNLAHKEMLFYEVIYLSNITGIPLRHPYLDGGTYIKNIELFNYGSTPSSDDGVYYGILPGAYHSDHNHPFYTATGLVEFDGSGVFTGDKFIGITTNAYNEFYINTSEDWDI
jgi:hypothetical protein